MNVILNGVPTVQTAKWLTYGEIARLVNLPHPIVNTQMVGGELGPLDQEESVTLTGGLIITAVEG